MNISFWRKSWWLPAALGMGPLMLVIPLSSHSKVWWAAMLAALLMGAAHCQMIRILDQLCSEVEGLKKRLTNRP